MTEQVLSTRHVTGINMLSDADIALLLARGNEYADRLAAGDFRSDVLRGRVVMTMFFENSTRTRISFEMAAKRLGAEVIDFETATSSLKKGETFLDTILNLDVYAPDAMIVRHQDYGAPDYIAHHVHCPVINAGDSWREHPTQALLDALTIQRARGKIEGLTIAICGDIAHSRVAASNMQLLSRLGARLRVIAPEILMPAKLPVEGIEAYTTLEDGLPGCDIVMMLRPQKERMETGLIGSDEDYFRVHGLTHDRLRLARAEALVMHPGPMNRNVEIADEVADDTRRSLILEQARMGVPMRMAVLDLLINR